jgi:hypothetical protein
VSEEKLKRKVTKDKQYSSIQKLYKDIMLVQELPFVKNQTVMRYNRMMSNLQLLLETKQKEANICLK